MVLLSILSGYNPCYFDQNRAFLTHVASRNIYFELPV
jgi:hypothetical protein